jgi:hypothetical protein
MTAEQIIDLAVDLRVAPGEIALATTLMQSGRTEEAVVARRMTLREALAAARAGEGA